MNEIKNETDYENLFQSASEVAKHSTLSFSLSGWPAAIALISIPASIVLIYGIKEFVTHA